MSKSLKFFIVLFLAFLAIMSYSSNTFAAVNMNSSALNSNTSSSSNTSSTNTSNTNSSKTNSPICFLQNLKHKTKYRHTEYLFSMAE